MTEPIKSATWLFRLAIEWYRDHPGQQIPLDMWEQQVLASQNNAEMKILYIGTQAVKRFDYNMIPGLAAISLRAPPQQLLEVIKHHNITVEEANFLSFPWCPKDTVPSEPGDDQLLIPALWPVTKAFVDAMSLDDQLMGHLEVHLQRYYDEEAFEMACIISIRENLWFKTKLAEHFDLRHKGGASGIACPRLMSAETLKDAIKLDEFSDEHVLSLLDRSGNLLPDVNAENGFKAENTVGFFRKLFCQRDNRGNFDRIIEAMNRTEDPVMISAIADRLLSAIPDYEDRANGLGSMFFEAISKKLDPSRYGHVLESMVLQLCLLPIYDMANVKDDEFERYKTPAQRDFCKLGAVILKRLNDELKDLAPNAWRKRHFDAIGTLISEWSVPQDLTGIDLHEFLIKTLSALDAYKSTDHLDYLSEKMDCCADEAERHVKTLIRFVSKTIEVDYDRLGALPSASKALLVSGGVNLRKLPGINNRDKGALLSEGLGL